MNAEFVLLNARIATMGPEGDTTGGLAAMGGRIVAESPVKPDGSGTRMVVRFPGG